MSQQPLDKAGTPPRASRGPTLFPYVSPLTTTQLPLSSQRQQLLSPLPPPLGNILKAQHAPLPSSCSAPSHTSQAPSNPAIPFLNNPPLLQIHSHCCCQHLKNIFPRFSKPEHPFSQTSAQQHPYEDFPDFPQQPTSPITRVTFGLCMCMCVCCSQTKRGNSGPVALSAQSSTWGDKC